LKIEEEKDQEEVTKGRKSTVGEEPVEMIFLMKIPSVAFPSQ